MLKSRVVPFIALTETWLKSHITNAQMEIENYTINRCDRGTRIGGGVALYSHNSIPVTDNVSFDDNISQVLICRFDTIKMIISVIYRPPQAPASSMQSCTNFISSYISNHSDDFESCISGDINLPDVEWQCLSIPPGVPSTDHASAQFVFEFMADKFHSQLIEKSTRGDNILDIFLTNSPNLVSHVDVTETPLSDHRIVELYLSYNLCHISKPIAPTFTSSSFRSLNFEKADYNSMNSAFSEINWKGLWDLCTDPLEEFPELFTLLLLQICEIFCPRKKPASSKQCRSLQALSRKKRRIKKQLDRAMQNPTSTTAHVKALNNKLALAFADIKDAINNNLAYKEQQAVNKVKDNSKYFFSYAKKFSKQKHSISMLFDENKNIHSSPDKIANLLQQQFCGVFSDPSKTDITSATFNAPQVTYPLTEDFLDFTISDVIEAIGEIKSSAAAGPDEVPVQLLHNCKNSLAIPIYIIWFHSKELDKVPQFYKDSNVNPLFKKGSKALPENYRPVSLTSHIVKIYERILRKKMVSHMEKNDLFCKSQHGFRSGRSCLTQLLHHFDDIIDSLVSGADVDTIYLDYAKAFDKVDHKLLLAKVQLYGFPSKLVRWIESFLSNRYQKVVVDGFPSVKALILSGVPQGTVLGVILFLIFINDLGHCVTSSTLRCFADDSKICKAISHMSDVHLLQTDLENVLDWTDRNNMTAHEDKFDYMCHRENVSNLLLHLPFISMCFHYSTPSGVDISPKSHIRDLGVITSDDLSWSKHIGTICVKARQMAAWVFSVFYTRSPVIVLPLYKSLVRCHIEYCSPLWNPYKIEDIQQLESIQRSFTSRIAGLKDLHYWDRLKKLSLMSLQRRRERYIVIHMWKLKNGYTSNDLQISFVNHKRHGIVAEVPALAKGCRSKFQTIRENSFKIKGPRLWNCIPKLIRSYTVLDTFKKQLTKFTLLVPDKPPIRGYTTPNSNSLLDWQNNKEASVFYGGWIKD